MKSLSFLFISVLLIASCQNQHSYDKEQAAISDSLSIYGATGSEVKLVKRASVEFKVKDVESSARNVGSIAKGMGGMVVHQAIRSNESVGKEIPLSGDSIMVISSVTPVAEISVRVPSNHLDSFMFTVTGLGYFTSQHSLDIEDKTLAYLENEWKAGARQDAAEIPIKSVTKRTAQTIALRDDIIDKTIAGRAIDADARYSLMHLQLYQNPLVRKEVVANTDLSDYSLPFTKKAVNALAGGWEMLFQLLIGIMSVWPLILMLLLSFMAYRYFSGKGVSRV